MKSIAGAVILLLVISSTYAFSSGEQPVDADEVIQAAMAKAGTIPGQATVLTELAWSSEGEDRPDVAAAARSMLVEFGEHGMHAMRRKLRTAAPEHHASIIQTMIDAYGNVPTGIPTHYLAGMEDALWICSPEARELAMKPIGDHRYTLSVLPIIDSAVEYPELIPKAIETLTRLGDNRARFFLKDVLHGDNASNRDMAAQALAQIGGQATGVLTSSMFSSEQDIRQAAARALIKVAGPEELTTLHEYVYMYPEDDPALLEEIRAVALSLERSIEAYHVGSGVGPDPEF